MLLLLRGAASAVVKRARCLSMTSTTLDVGAEFKAGGGKHAVVNGVLTMSPDLPVLTAVMVYEVLRVKNGIPMFAQQHAARLENSMKLVQMPTFDVDPLLGHLGLLVAADKIENQNVKLLCVKSPKGGGEAAKVDTFIYAIKSFYPPEEYYREGVKATTMQFKRDTPQAK
eukprot:Sspe_Gene.9440::Locus_3168_Transcript_1_1_Confidence_1.000_Length_550::g.9440::m.9440